MQSVAEVAPCSWAYRSSLRKPQNYSARGAVRLQRGCTCWIPDPCAWFIIPGTNRSKKARASLARLPPTLHPHSTPSVRVRRKTQSHRSGHGFDSRHSSKRTNGRSVKSGASRVSIWLAGWRLETKTAEPKKERRASSASLDLQP
jgi:hypothetical protein